jgi:hypothetical protein
MRRLRAFFLVTPPSLIVFKMKFFFHGWIVAGPVVNVEKPLCFFEAFPSSRGNPYQEEVAEGHPIVLRISMAAAFSTGCFVFLFWFFFLLLTSFPCGKPAGSRYE